MIKGQDIYVRGEAKRAGIVQSGTMCINTWGWWEVLNKMEDMRQLAQIINQEVLFKHKINNLYCEGD